VARVLAWPSALLLALFALVHFGLVFTGFWLRVDAPAATLIWLPTGWLLAVLWFSPWRRWPVLLALATIAEMVGGLVFGEPFPTLRESMFWGALFAAANALSAAAGAALARRWQPSPMVVGSRPVLPLVTASALAAVVGACIGAAGLSWLGAESGSYRRNWELWFLGDLLGAVVLTPVVLAWASRLLAVTHWKLRCSTLELALIYAASIGTALAVFVIPPSTASALLTLPYVTLLPLGWAVVRVPPRHAVSLAAIVVLIAAVASDANLGPFASAGSTAYFRLVPLQAFLCLVPLGTLITTQAVSEGWVMQDALLRSETRYRSYVELSSEPIWRIELTPPVDIITLPMAEQLRATGERGYFAECSRKMQAIAASGDLSAFFAEPLRAQPWFTLLEQHWAVFVRNGYRLDGLEWSQRLPNKPRLGLYVSFMGMIESGKLTRIWGVARDVTELKETQAALERERELLQEYAALLVSAEERARRTTAIDLHDGLAQLLVAAKLRLQAVKRVTAQAPDAAKDIEAIDTILEDATASTRGLIADLSPPGLYESGLAPALRWLADQMASRHELAVEVRVADNLDDISETARVTTFRVCRELLNNIVRHAGVDLARVSVERDSEHLQLVVEDRGNGFDPEALARRDVGPGFGLFSVRDQVRYSGGTLRIHSRRGEGTRVTVRVPLNSGLRLNALAT
jgi:signal transduction histidine kinase